jgi:hypothetical protein
VADDLLDTLDAAAFCADHTEWQTAIRSASEEIVRLRAVLDAIDALHRGLYHCCECDFEWPCPTHLLIHHAPEEADRD